MTERTQCGECKGTGSVATGQGWAICQRCGGSGGVPVTAPEAALSTEAPAVPTPGVSWEHHEQVLSELRDARQKLVEASRRHEVERREQQAMAEQAERLRMAVAEAHARARGVTDEVLTARRLFRAVLWRLDLLGDEGPSTVRLAIEALLSGEERAARKGLDHAVPALPKLGARLNLETEHAIRLRLANAPEAVQADVDAVLRELTSLRAEHELGAAYIAALNGENQLAALLVETERRGEARAAREITLALVEGVRGMYDDTDGPEDLPTLDSLNALAPALREAVLTAVRKIEERTARQLLERIKVLLVR